MRPNVSDTIEFERALNRRVLGKENGVAVVGVVVEYVLFGDASNSFKFTLSVTVTDSFKGNSFVTLLRIGERIGPTRGLLLLLDGLGKVSVEDAVAKVTVDG